MKITRAETDCYYWLTELTQTIDEQDRENPYKPFPRKAYIQATLPVLEAEDIVLIPKSRSMMASWTVAGLAAWICQTRRATGIIIQSRDETRARKLVEYVRILYRQSHPEWQKRHPLAKRLESQVETECAWANDSWVRAIPGTPSAIRSEHPTIYVSDEAGFMDSWDECFNVARGAKPLHCWALSSAEKGGFFDVLENAVPCDWGGFPSQKAVGSLDQFASADVTRPVKGLTFGRNEKGWAVIHMHYSADPERGAEWVAKEKQKYTSDADWNKEQEINPYAKDGALKYPEFDARIHVIPHSKIPLRLTRYMAIDPHPRTPHAFLWVGIDQWGDWYFYRELWPSVVYAQPKTLRDNDLDNRYTIREYVETIAEHLEGNRVIWSHPETDDEYGTIKFLPAGERIVCRFMDQAGKAFGTDGDAHESETYWKRYERFGIQCLPPTKSHQAGEDAIRDGLKPRFHDLKGKWPKFHISDRCPELAFELKRHRYKSTRRLNPERELSQDGVESRCHLVDLMRYLATAPISYIPEEESPECIKSH